MNTDCQPKRRCFHPHPERHGYTFTSIWNTAEIDHQNDSGRAAAAASQVRNQNDAAVSLSAARVLSASDLARLSAAAMLVLPRAALCYWAVIGQLLA